MWEKRSRERIAVTRTQEHGKMWNLAKDAESGLGLNPSLPVTR